jgi:hypothetical protein
MSKAIIFVAMYHRLVSIKKHRPFYFPKHNFSETGFCPRPQVKPQLGPIDRVSPYLLTQTRQWIMSKNIIFIFILRLRSREIV